MCNKIEVIQQDKLPKCVNCFHNAYGGECQISCYQVNDDDTCESFVHPSDVKDEG